MCAASVYPEPGSNSLVLGIYIFGIFIPLYKSFFKLSLTSLVSSLFFMVVQKLPLIGLFKGFIVYFSMYFFVPSFLWNVLYYTTSLFHCQHIFKIFFSFFILSYFTSLKNFFILSYFTFFYLFR